MSRLIQASAIAMILLVWTASSARADLTITLSDVNLAPGATGAMDITVTSNNNDTLSAFSLGLLITPVGTPTSLLQFSSGADQPTPYANPNYVFYGQSFSADYIIPFWSPPYQSFAVATYPSDSITGGDSADSSAGYVTIPTTVPATVEYLATVQFQSQPGAPLTDQFQISLVSNPDFTYFDDQNGNPLTIDSVNGGLVTFASAVPEPSSLTIVALSGLSGLLWWYRRGRKHGQSKDSPLREQKKVDIAL